MTLKNFLVATSLFFFICMPKVDAKIVMNKLPLLTYAETPISVYDAPGGTKNGTITMENSLVLVKVIRPDGWAYGSYKVANKKKRPYGWFNMNELQGYADFENYVEHTNYDVNAYRTRTSSKLIGKVASDEDIIVVAKRGDKVKIIFKADGNYYRMGWFNKNNLSSNSASYDNNDSSSSDNSSDEVETENDSDVNYDGGDEGENMESEDDLSGETIALYDS